MLDTETKKKIDNCRDILVGKIPDPKAQVEQITMALMYKFMDDMDKESVEIGGKPSFFVDEYKQYSWSKLMSPKLGGQEKVILYAEALTKMPQNPHIPQLFRDIFKGAYLPYRAPETIRLFLKEINEFTYDHSERLGDAYEYLLSIMSSQGDAGQFRTPRNIIDFIVEVVDPQKDESVLDPACGTAGFLISGYKHILKNNKDKLNPTEKEKLMNNFVGYDISPDMVKMSKVNMYLHKFPIPNIYEYDTLSSQKKWDDTFDVIMANPPFMTPTGGIKPHNRFTIRSKRAEALFVDYIKEHLNINGRAGVIVPEGIIFKNENAIKALRKNLVEENYLYAVVSLPAGVFNPYAGVKTSVLLMDRKLAKKTDNILFVKIENDGYDLGATRKPIDKNDIPDAIEILKDYQKNILSGKKPEIADKDSKLANIVEKEKIAEDGQYNLSGSRYRKIKEIQTDYKLVELEKICEIYQPKTITRKQMSENGKYPVFGANGIIGFYNKYNHEDPEVLVTCRGATCGKINISKPKSWVTGNAMVVSPKKSIVNKTYLYYVLQNADLSSVISGAAQPQITRTNLSPYKIPLPPLEVQKEIVAEVESYQKIIDGAKQVVENYKPRIDINENWKKVNFQDICVLEYGKSLPKRERKEGKYPVMGSNGITGYHNEYLIKGPAIIVGRKGSAGEVVWTRDNCFPIDTTYYVKLVEKNYDYKFLYYILSELKLMELKNGAGIPGLNRNDVYKRYKIPYPSLKEQKRIIQRIEKEQNIIEQNNKLMKMYEKKIKDRISKVWGEK